MQTVYPVNILTRDVTTSYEWDTYTTKDWLLIAASVVILLGYEGFYLALYHYSPHRCTLHRNIQCRKRWIEGLVRKKGSEVLVVQSLRNGILAANFFAGASSTIALFIMGQLRTIGGVDAAQLWGVCVFLFLSFLNFVIVIRNYNHLSFHVHNDAEESEFEANPALKTDALKHSQTLMSRATVHHFLGTRCFYLIIVILGWKISTTGMVGAALLLVPWLAYHDFV